MNKGNLLTYLLTYLLIYIYKYIFLSQNRSVLSDIYDPSVLSFHKELYARLVNE